MAEVKFQYEHKTRKCEFPGCEKLGHSQGKVHADKSLYRRAWCKTHLKGKGKLERIEYSKGKKKYQPKKVKILSTIKE